MPESLSLALLEDATSVVISIGHSLDAHRLEGTVASTLRWGLLTTSPVLAESIVEQRRVEGGRDLPIWFSPSPRSCAYLRPSILGVDSQKFGDMLITALIFAFLGWGIAV